MEKFMISDGYIISMDDYLLNYCQLPEDFVYRCRGISHDKIKKMLDEAKQTRFPISHYREGLTLMGIILWVKDCKGRTIPYINPNLLTNVSKEQIIAQLSKGREGQYILESILNVTKPQVVPISFEAKLDGNTRKRSYQKVIEKERNGYNDQY